MNLFNPVVDNERLHPNFISVLYQQRESERQLLQSWAEGFVDRDGKFVTEFQTTFNSSFWEIYLFALLKTYNFEVDWSIPSPDFCISNNENSFVIEATTANAAHGNTNEWDKTFSLQELSTLRKFKALNTEAMIRLSNSIHAKHEKYMATYSTFPHVKGKPFILAVAPFEQPHFNLQHDRAIRAVLYDYYVDEDAFLDNPSAFPDGPPGVNLGRVYKNSGAPIELGLFNNAKMSSISAIVFSCVASWGKLSAISNNEQMDVMVNSVWSVPPTGALVKKRLRREDHFEEIHDGLQIFHNPYADNPLNPEVFRRNRVIQHYIDQSSGDWVYENSNDALHYRQTILLPRKTL